MITRTDVICIGSATVDHFLIVDQPLKSIKLGDKILIKNKEMHSGGGATNAAATFAKMGLKVKVLVKLGDDADGDFVQRDLVEYRIKSVPIPLSKKPTDTAMIVSSLKEKDRIIFVRKGASEDLSFDDFKNLHLKAKWIYLSTLMGKSFQTSKKIAQYAEKKRINLLFNPSLYLAKKGKRYLAQILRATTILVLNKEETQALLGISSNSFSVLLKSLQKLGPKIVVITDGIRKMHALNGDIMYEYLPPNEKVVHTAGAGDAFTAGFLSGLIKKYSFSEALQIGQVNATSVVQIVGTKNGILTEKEALKAIKKYKIKCTQRKI